MTNDYFGQKWGNLPMIFMGEEVTRQNHSQIASHMTKKLFTVTLSLFYMSLLKMAYISI